MSKKTEIRESIFKSFSKNFALISYRYGDFSDSDGHRINTKENNFYVCPLCKILFTKESLNQTGPNPLTIEDLPPKSVGKKVLILTCKRCNNNAGGKLDHTIKSQIESEPFLKNIQDSEIDATFQLTNNSYARGKLVVDGKDSYKFNLHHSTNQFLSSKYDEYLLDLAKRNLTLKFSVPNIRILQIAYLRIGYLIFFRYFGYAYLFDPNIKKIWEQIVNPNVEILDNLGVRQNVTDKFIPVGIHLLKSPNHLKTYIVVIKPKVMDIENTIVIYIPGPGEEGWECYKNAISFTGKEKLDFTKLPYNNFITNLELINAYYYLFKHL